MTNPTMPVPEADASFSRADASMLRRFAQLPTANIGDAMERMGAADARIKPVWAGAKLVGSAFTVWTRPGDNYWLHEALNLARPGDVIVVNGGGDESRALMGELIGGRAKALGIAGFIIDGAVRDADGLAAYNMPVFARATTPAGPYKDGPGLLLQPVALGGVVASPGDIVVADADGVVVVPLAYAAHLLSQAEAKQASEADSRAAIARSLSTPAGRDESVAARG